MFFVFRIELLHFGGVVDEYLQPFVGQRMVEQAFDGLERTGSHIGSEFQPP